MYHVLLPRWRALFVAAALAPGTSLFGRIVARLLFALQSRSRALMVAACKAAGVLFEARAWCASMAGGQRAESEGVTRALRVLQGYLSAGELREPEFFVLDP